MSALGLERYRARADERGRAMDGTHAGARPASEGAGRADCAAHTTHSNTLWLRTNPGAARKDGA